MLPHREGNEEIDGRVGMEGDAGRERIEELQKRIRFSGDGGEDRNSEAE